MANSCQPKVFSTSTAQARSIMKYCPFPVWVQLQQFEAHLIGTPSSNLHNHCFYQWFTVAAVCTAHKMHCSFFFAQAIPSAPAKSTTSIIRTGQQVYGNMPIYKPPSNLHINLIWKYFVSPSISLDLIPGTLNMRAWWTYFHQDKWNGLKWQITNFFARAICDL